MTNGDPEHVELTENNNRPSQAADCNTIRLPGCVQFDVRSEDLARQRKCKSRNVFRYVHSVIGKKNSGSKQLMPKKGKLDLGCENLCDVVDGLGQPESSINKNAASQPQMALAGAIC